jgi:L-alanine-DL-glutamate epimerase-like enolase superfamily enzyme
VCPIIEYLVSYMGYRHFFEKAPPAALNGKIELPAGPGFGIAFAPEKIEKQTALTWR